MEKLLDNSKSKNAIIVLEGLGIFLIFHSIGSYYISPYLAAVFSQTPFLTIAMLSSSSISPLMAIIYLAFKTKSIPKIVIKRKTFLVALAGIFLTWILIFINVLFSGKNSIFIQEILKTPHPYYYFNLFLFILWGPFLEEILSRSYFFEILRINWGNLKSLLFTSILFVIPHGIFGGFDIFILFIFLYSVVFTIIYLEGGLIASIISHSFANFYMVYLNM